MVEQEQVYETLRHVMDPEIGANVVDLGLIRSVQIEDQEIHVRMVLTMAGCPLERFLTRSVQQAVEAVAEGKRVEVDLLQEEWVPPWMQETGT